MTCQKQGSLTLKTKLELHSIPVPTAVMSRIGVDVFNLPKVDGYCQMDIVQLHLQITLEKGVKRNNLKVKKPDSSQFLYELICRHDCFPIKINEQVREFVNSVSVELHRLIGTIQRQLVRSAYHPQANGLVERQNRAIKKSLLDNNPINQPYVTEGVLFAHRITTHASTKYSRLSFYTIEKQSCRLAFSVIPTQDLSNLDEPFDKDMSDTVLASATS